MFDATVGSANGIPQLLVQYNLLHLDDVARSEELVPAWWFHGEFWLTLLLICRKWKYNLGHYMPLRSSTLVR